MAEAHHLSIVTDAGRDDAFVRPKGRKHFPPPNDVITNVLTGLGPHAPAADPALGKPASFKPGWNTKRPHKTIEPEQVREERTKAAEMRNTQCQAMRSSRLTEWHAYNRFNPVTGWELGQAGWQESTNGWQHRRPSVKPVQGSEMIGRPSPSKVASAEARTIMRREIMLKEGLTATIKDASVADNFRVPGPPTTRASRHVTAAPTPSERSAAPSKASSARPTPPPSNVPSARPSPPPSKASSARPTPPPSNVPSARPTPPPSNVPSARPSPPPSKASSRQGPGSVRSAPRTPPPE